MSMNRLAATRVQDEAALAKAYCDRQEQNSQKKSSDALLKFACDSPQSIQHIIRGREQHITSISPFIGRFIHRSNHVLQNKDGEHH